MTFVADCIAKSLIHPSTNLAKNEREFILILLKDSPEAITQIDNAIQEIMKDNQIDFHDIPEIILIISTTMKNCKIKTKADMIVIIQFILDAVLDSGMLPLPACEIEIIHRVVDSSMRLLTTTITKNEPNKCWFC